MAKNPDSPSSRRVALELLRSVLNRRQFLDDALATMPALRDLSARDRAFARLLAATALRRLGQIDALIEESLERPLPKNARDVLHILRLGAVQLLFLKTPPHAAVDTGVTLAREGGLGRYAGLVNAVLRRFARQGETLVENQDAERLNTPEWLWKSWQKTYGEEATRKMARMHAMEPPLDITCTGDAEDWAQKLSAILLPTGSLRLLEYGHIPELPGFDEGAWWVQDTAASLPAKLLLSGLGGAKGKRLLDLCAAPGGKTAQLASAGAEVIAVDRSQKRLDTLEKNMNRLRLNAEIICAEAMKWLSGDSSGSPKALDAILLDAPCSATGTLRRHPDVAWLKTGEDVAKCASLQDRLLEAAMEALSPGGILLYCTCSLQNEEGPERIAALLDKVPAAARLAIRAEEVGGMAEIVTQEGDLRTLPCHFSEQGGMDGFFAARLTKI